MGREGNENGTRKEREWSENGTRMDDHGTGMNGDEREWPGKGGNTDRKRFPGIYTEAAASRKGPHPGVEGQGGTATTHPPEANHTNQAAHAVQCIFDQEERARRLRQFCSFS